MLVRLLKVLKERMFVCAFLEPVHTCYRCFFIFMHTPVVTASVRVSVCVVFGEVASRSRMLFFSAEDICANRRRVKVRQLTKAVAFIVVR